jgi:hypothetical protein
VTQLPVSVSDDRLIQLNKVGIKALRFNLRRGGFKHLLKLIDKGARVKATGFGRVNFDVQQVVKTIYSANPDALMFGTDLPSTRADRVYSDQDFLLVLDSLGEQGASKVFSRNALDFYRK